MARLKSTITPFRARKIEIGRTELEFWNAVLSRTDRRIPIASSGSEFSFRVVEKPKASGFGFLVETQNGVAFPLIIDEFPFEQWFGIELQYSDTARLPAKIAEAIDEGIINAIRELLPIELDATIAAVTRQKIGPLLKRFGASDLVWAQSSLYCGPELPVVFSAGIQPAQLMKLSGIGELGKVRIHPELSTRINCSLNYSLPPIELDLEEIRALEMGDLLVLDAKTDKTVLYVTGGKSQYVFNAHEGCWVCTNVRPHPVRHSVAAGQKRGGPMEDEARSKGTADTGSIPVIIDFDIGNLELPVSELETWHPGSIIELDPPELSEDVEVRIRANGQLLGTGDLVRVDDRLAVRINKMNHPPELEEAAA